jgi:hypothetical protein
MNQHTGGKEMGAYEFAINNMKQHIRSSENRRLAERGDPEAMNVFTVAPVLAIAFMKKQEEVVADLIKL